MLSRNVDGKAKREGMRLGERARGLPDTLLRFSSTQAINNQVPEVSRLPIADIEETKLQDEETGELLYIEGWTQVDPSAEGE